MKIKLIVIVLLINNFYAISQSEFSYRVDYIKILDISTNVNIYDFNKQHIYENNINFVFYPMPLIKSIVDIKKFDFGVGFGLQKSQIYNKYIYNLKIASLYTINKKRRIKSGLMIDYFPKPNEYIIGLHLRKDIKLFKFFLNYNIFFTSGISYMSQINNVTLNLGLGLNFEDVIHYKKPVVYFYPTDTMDLEVKLDFKGKFTFTWPKYNDKWIIKIYPNSEILNKLDGKHYNYLFWEGTYSKPLKDTIKTGFIVYKNNLASFLISKLEIVGLNEREINDFITYWVPLLNKNKYLIHFVQNEQCNFFAKYDFTQNPQSFIRLMVLFIDTEKDLITEQKLSRNVRKGFTIVEWGGVDY